jgi:DNA polymerase
MDMRSLLAEMRNCNACKLRRGCKQVVVPDGCLENPLLAICAEAPGQTEDEEGVPLIGAAGEVLRDVLRSTKVLNRTNTLLMNVVNCRPPKNKFPTDESASICVSKWLWQILEAAQPQRLLLLGGVALKYVANMEGITSSRGNWYRIKGIRTMATFHPSFILRTDRDGFIQNRRIFESDINQVADEIRQIIAERK